MFCCLKSCFNGNENQQTVPLLQENPICLDISHMGNEVVIIKGGTRACGSGCVLGTAPLVQSKSYFEVKIQQGGVWGVGLATRHTDLNKFKGGQDKDTWCICSDNCVYNEGRVVHQLSEKPVLSDEEFGLEFATTEQQFEKYKNFPAEGDTIGVAFDHIELNFYLNGRNLEVPINHLRGAIYPALYVDDGAILDVVFTDFNYQPPPGFDRIMIEQSLL